MDTNNPQLQVAMLTNTKPMIGKEELSNAITTLQKYRDGKANLTQRIIEEEKWWELRHWEVIRSKKNPKTPKPTSAWLFNTLVNRHADAMDNIPTPVVLPRERGDEEAARMLTSVLPVIMEQNDFEQSYSDAWWDKVKHGTAAYGVFWDSEALNGLGDIKVEDIDLLRIYWEPGVTDIQDSRNLFVLNLEDEEVLNQMYPEYKGRLNGNPVDLPQYDYDDSVDTTGKSVVVDWYYKRKSLSGKTIVHFCKFCGDVILESTENDPELRDVGLYNHGLYPFVFDTLYPVKGTPVGHGLISICKDPQLYIDEMDSAFMESALNVAKVRWFKDENTKINVSQFLDVNNPMVDVSGGLDDLSIRQILTQPLAPIYYEVQQGKINEMKETSSNRDVSNGGVPSGISAAAAISALQEAGNKVSRDSIKGSFRAARKIYGMVEEDIAQFYVSERCFRITGGTGEWEFVAVSNLKLKDSVVADPVTNTEYLRKPEFDFKIKAERTNPFSRAEQNERAKELYAMGFFNPQKAQESLIALDMMDFEGKDKIVDQVRQGETLYNMVQQLAGQVDQLMGLLGAGQPVPAGEPAPAEQSASAPGGKSIEAKNVDAQTANATSYGERLAQRSTPKVEGA